MKIFITGATGFIGRHLAKRLLENGHEVIAGGRSFGKLGAICDKVKKVYTNIEDQENILSILREEKPDIEYHCAALVESTNLERLMQVNKEGTRIVLDSCLKENVKKIIYLSSIAVVTGNKEVPLREDLPFCASNHYGESKLEAEKIALKYRKKGLEIAILRPCMVYGENEPHGLKRLKKALRLRMLPTINGGKNKLQLVSVENVVDVMMLCLDKKEAYEGSYFIADKEALNMGEVFNLIGDRKPFNISEGFAKILSKTPLVKKIIFLLSKERCYSIDRLKNKLGYTPRISTIDGLQEALK